MNEQIQIIQEEMRPCEGCKGLTKKNKIWQECWECRGEGYVENDDWQWSAAYMKCSNCHGDGGWDNMLFFCSQDCYLMSNYDD